MNLAFVHLYYRKGLRSTQSPALLFVNAGVSNDRYETIRDVFWPGGADNEKGSFEIYRASKAALNTLKRSFAARHQGDGRSLLLSVLAYWR